MWSTGDELLEVAMSGKGGEYVVPGPTKKGMPKKRRARGLAKPKKGGYLEKDVPHEAPMPKQPATPKVKGSRSQKDVRSYPQYADMLEIKPISVMGLKFPAVKVRLPVSNVTKNRRFIKGVDWAISTLAVAPSRELATQEKNAAANLKRLKGASSENLAAHNRMNPMGIPRVTSPLHMILDKMSQIATRKGGGSARALEQSGDPFWLGVLYLGRALSTVAPWNALDKWRAKEVARLFKKYADLELDLNTGKIVIPQTEAKGETAHDKCGKFCAKHKAVTVTKNGTRYKPVRQLRRLKGKKAKTRSKHKPPQEEAVVSVVGALRDRDAIEAMLHPSGQWQSLEQVFPTALREV